MPAPVTYQVTLADLITIADAAAELDESRRFYVDQPAEQDRLAAHVIQLHDIVERAAHVDAARIYGRKP